MKEVNINVLRGGRVSKMLLMFAVYPDMKAWDEIFEDACEASDILSRKELEKYIEEKRDLLPQSYFERGTSHVHTY